MKKVVLVTGGSDGLGKAIAQYLQTDYQVIILSPSEDKVLKVASEIGVDYVVSDVSDYKDIKVTIDKIVKKYGRIDCLINNAGLWIQGELDDNKPDEIKRVVEVNNLGIVFVSKAVIPQMKKQKSGLIVNINSQGGYYAKPERSVYSAAKWGVTGFTKSLQSELAKYGISVTGIYPGKMDTKMFEKMGIEKDMSDALNPIEVARVVKFLLETNPTVNFPEIGVKNINN